MEIGRNETNLKKNSTVRFPLRFFFYYDFVERIIQKSILLMCVLCNREIRQQFKFRTNFDTITTSKTKLKNGLFFFLSLFRCKSLTKSQ